MIRNIYPNGRCEFCGKEFKRPNKFRTEGEAFHHKLCWIENIKFRIKQNEDKYLLIEELEEIKHKLSFGGNDKIYYDKMIECNNLIKKLTQE